MEIPSQWNLILLIKGSKLAQLHSRLTNVETYKYLGLCKRLSGLSAGLWMLRQRGCAGWDGVMNEPGSGVHCAPHQGTAGLPSGTEDGPPGQISSEAFCFCTESEVLNAVLLWEL